MPDITTLGTYIGTTLLGLPSAEKSVSGIAERISPSRRGFLKKTAIAEQPLYSQGYATKIVLSVMSGQPAVQSSNVIPVNPQPSGAGLQDPRIKDLIGSEVTDNRVFYRVDIDPFREGAFGYHGIQVTVDQ